MSGVPVLLRAADYVEQAEVTNWPARFVLVLATVLLIGLALWGMRRGWQNRKARQDWIPQPADAPPTDRALTRPVEGVFLGSSAAGDWMDRIVVFALGVRSRASASCSSDGIWLDRTGARSVFIPAADIVRLRLDRGVASTVRAKDSVIVVTWRLGDATIDTGFRADDTPGHRAVLDGLAAVLGLSPAPTDLQEQNSTGQENGESGPA